jgi:agmatinase
MMDRERAEKLVSGAEESLAPTFFRFGALPAELSTYESSRFAILPIPYDSTSSYRTGSRHGPVAIIEASRHLELYDHELDELPARFGIHTCSELEVDASGPEGMTGRIEQVTRDLLNAGKAVGAIGGDHSITCGIVKAHAERYPDLSVLQLDAHADLRDVYQGTKYSHACAMRRVREHAARVSQVGLRSYSADEAAFMKKESIAIHPASSWRGERAQIDAVLSDLGDGPVYVTFDLDVLDPAYMPATGTPEPGGLGWWDVLKLLDAVSAEKEIVGFDVVELIPMAETIAPDFLAAKLVYKLISFMCREQTGRAR